MQVSGLEINREEARKRVEEFTAARRRDLTEADRALYRGYKALAEGLTVIDVEKVLREGGHFEETYCPRLALIRADVATVFYDHSFYYTDGLPIHGGSLGAWRWGDDSNSTNPHYVRAQEESKALSQLLFDYAARVGLFLRFEDLIDSPAEERKSNKRWYKASYQTTVPTIPVHLRPKASEIEKYFILWEVEQWEQYRSAPAPGDPLLLERIAHPIYVVVAQWDLTELEKRILESFRR